MFATSRESASGLSPVPLVPWCRARSPQLQSCIPERVVGMRTAPSKHQGQRDSARSEAALVKGIEHFVHHLSLQKGSCEMPGVRQSRNSCIMLPPNLPFNPSLCINVTLQLLHWHCAAPGDQRDYGEGRTPVLCHGLPRHCATLHRLSICP